MVIINYKINGYIDEELTKWISSLPGFKVILQQDNYSLLVRFDHTPEQQLIFKTALKTKLEQNPDDIIKRDLLDK